MIECPTCKHREFVGTLNCSECGSRLVQTAPVSAFDPQATVVVDGPPTGPGLAVGAMLGLRVLSTGDMVSLMGRDNYTLGRSGGSQAIVPDVDLDTYGAAELGISRLHAEIRIEEGSLNVVDLDSVNGTSINGERLEPQVASRLRHKDTLQLGQLKLQVITRIRG